jgi:hypothetical protein
LIEGYRRTGDRHIADVILACMELAGVHSGDAG